MREEMIGLCKPDLPFWRSAILPSCHSAVPPFCRSAVLPFCRSAVLPFCRSAVFTIPTYKPPLLDTNTNLRECQIIICFNIVIRNVLFTKGAYPEVRWSPQVFGKRHITRSPLDFPQEIRSTAASTTRPFFRSKMHCNYTRCLADMSDTSLFIVLRC